MTRNRALLSVLVVAVVLLAGCGGLGGDGEVLTPTGTDGPTTNGTATTPADESSLADRRVALESPPPGLNDSGIADVDALLDAHRAALDERGAVTVTNLTVDGPRSSLNSNATVRWGADGTISTRTVNDVGRGSAEVQQYTNGTVSAVRQQTAARTTTSVFDAGGYVQRQAGAAGLRPYLTVGEFVPTGVEDGRVTLEATSVADGDGLGDNVTDFDATLVVGERGRLLSFEASVTSATAQGESTTTIDYELTDRTLDAAERQSWVDDAVAGATLADLSYERVGGTVAITNEGDEALPTGTFVSVATAGGLGPSAQQYVVQVTDPIQPGETVYVYRQTADAQQGSFAIGDRPDVDAAPIDGPIQVLVSGGGQIVDAETLADDDEG